MTTETTQQPTYTPIEALTLADLRGALDEMQRRGISPHDLLAYAMAIDCVEQARETQAVMREEDGDPSVTWTPLDEASSQQECDGEDGSLCDALYDDVGVVLRKLALCE